MHGQQNIRPQNILASSFTDQLSIVSSVVTCSDEQSVLEKSFGCEYKSLSIINVIRLFKFRLPHDKILTETTAMSRENKGHFFEHLVPVLG